MSVHYTIHNHMNGSTLSPNHVYTPYSQPNIPPHQQVPHHSLPPSLPPNDQMNNNDAG